MKKEVIVVIITLTIILGICVFGLIKGIQEENIEKEKIRLMKANCLTHCLDKGWTYSNFLGTTEDGINICECYD